MKMHIISAVVFTTLTTVLFSCGGSGSKESETTPADSNRTVEAAPPKTKVPAQTIDKMKKMSGYLLGGYTWAQSTNDLTDTTYGITGSWIKDPVLPMENIMMGVHTCGGMVRCDVTSFEIFKDVFKGADSPGHKRIYSENDIAGHHVYWMVVTNAVMNKHTINVSAFIYDMPGLLLNYDAMNMVDKASDLKSAEEKMIQNMTKAIEGLPAI